MPEPLSRRVVLVLAGWHADADVWTCPCGCTEVTEAVLATMPEWRWRRWVAAWVATVSAVN